MKSTTGIKVLLGLLILMALIAVSSIYYGAIKQKAKDMEIERLRTENQAFSLVVTKNNDTITIQKQRITDLKTAVEAGLIDNKALRAKGIKDVQTIIDLQVENRRLQLEANYIHPPKIIHDTVYVDGVPVISDYLKIPQPWLYNKDPWTYIAGTINSKGVTIDSLITYNQPNITLGWSRKFLKKSEPIISWSDQNPYSVVRDMSNVVIINNTPFYKKPWFHFCEGVAATFGAQYLIKVSSNQK
jgi:hypothetical protein